MKIFTAPVSYDYSQVKTDLRISLYGSDENAEGSVGKAIFTQIRKRKLSPNQRAWDLLSVALSVISSDRAGSRTKSPDGWTREIDLTVSVNDKQFWDSNKSIVEEMLRFLSTDIWRINFIQAEVLPPLPKKTVLPTEDCVALLSGGLDSLVGILDLESKKRRPFLVSHTVPGDAEKQRYFAKNTGAGLSHIQLNHNANVPKQDKSPPSQRTRSIIFLAYAVVIATTLEKYKNGDIVDLFMSENGLISINPPLTGSRLGSLSTRTTHPIFISLFQKLLTRAELNIKVINEYAFKTKGQMLLESSGQEFLINNASKSTSCGRFGRYGRKHCGRCVPCLIRRASFLKWGQKDFTSYHFDDLSIPDRNHAFFDDVRSASIAVRKVEQEGIRSLVGANLNTDILGDVSKYLMVAENGIKEVGDFLKKLRIK
ncbi:Qat anti-phage system QueC-like protein QatC [Cyclobacterium plantarum]|uniref:Qat anti-phage system QueC-like protein QatC n=1 Tax=Cyclobacterium plantarum TaxID=2716263 RepID=UPI003F6FEACF